jgi:beta-lactamase class A
MWRWAWRSALASVAVLLVGAPGVAAQPVACPAADRSGWEYSPPGRGVGRFGELAGQLAPIVGRQAGSWGIAIADISSDETLLYRADDQFIAASLYKLGVLAEVYRELAAGRVGSNETVTLTEQDVDEQYGGSAYAAGESLSLSDALDAMITRSDNGVALALIRRLGLNAVNGEFQTLSMPHTRLIDDAWTTPRDQLSFFRQLARGEVVSASASRNMLDLLARQQINDRIPAGLPADGLWKVAHKTGNWTGSLADSGVIDTPSGAFVLSILSDDVVSYADAVHVFEQVTLQTYGAFEGASPAVDPGVPLADRTLCLEPWPGVCPPPENG